MDFIKCKKTDCFNAAKSNGYCSIHNTDDDNTPWGGMGIVMGDGLNTGIPGGLDMDLSTPF